MNQMLAQFGGPSFGGPPPIFMFFFVAIFVVVIGSILVKTVKGVSEWTSNNAQPVETEEGELVAKRTEVSGGEKSTSTTYYATFELADGERVELEISGRDYGQFAEGDRGQLTHQGTRYLGFTRQRERSASVATEPTVPPHLTCDYCGSAIPGGQVKCASCGWTWKPKPGESALTT